MITTVVATAEITWKPGAVPTLNPPTLRGFQSATDNSGEQDGQVVFVPDLSWNGDFRSCRLIVEPISPLSANTEAPNARWVTATSIVRDVPPSTDPGTVVEPSDPRTGAPIVTQALILDTIATNGLGVRNAQFSYRLTLIQVS